MIKYIKLKTPSLASVLFNGTNIQEILDFDPDNIFLVKTDGLQGSGADYPAMNGERINAGDRVIHQDGRTWSVSNNEFHRLYEEDKSPRGVIKYPARIVGNSSEHPLPGDPMALKAFIDDSITKQL